MGQVGAAASAQLTAHQRLSACSLDVAARVAALHLCIGRPRGELAAPSHIRPSGCRRPLYAHLHVVQVEHCSGLRQAKLKLQLVAAGRRWRQAVQTEVLGYGIHLKWGERGGAGGFSVQARALCSWDLCCCFRVSTGGSGAQTSTAQTRRYAGPIVPRTWILVAPNVTPSPSRTQFTLMRVMRFAATCTCAL